MNVGRSGRKSGEVRQTDVSSAAECEARWRPAQGGEAERERALSLDCGRVGVEQCRPMEFDTMSHPNYLRLCLIWLHLM